MNSNVKTESSTVWKWPWSQRPNPYTAPILLHEQSSPPIVPTTVSWQHTSLPISQSSGPLNRKLHCHIEATPAKSLQVACHRPLAQTTFSALLGSDPVGTRLERDASESSFGSSIQDRSYTILCCESTSTWILTGTG